MFAARICRSMHGQKRRLVQNFYRPDRFPAGNRRLLRMYFQKFSTGNLRLPGLEPNILSVCCQVRIGLTVATLKVDNFDILRSHHELNLLLTIPGNIVADNLTE